MLVLDTLRHSYVDPATRHYLEFGYMRTFAAALDTLPSGPCRCCTSVAAA